MLLLAVKVIRLECRWLGHCEVGFDDGVLAVAATMVCSRPAWDVVCMFEKEEQRT